MKSFSLLVVLAALAAPAAAQNTAPTQVTLPLAEYERLKKSEERPSLTVVDTLKISGSFRGQGLALSLTGRSAGKQPPLKVLDAAEDVALFGCEGDGIVSRADDGGFSLTPLAPKFDVRCRIGASGSDRLALRTTRGVLHVEAAVADGELVPGGATGDGGRSFTIVRMAGASGETLPATASGRYRITMRPDETRFVWQVDAHNPNRARRPFDLTLRSGEHVQQVDAQAPYEVEKGRYRFDLPPGDTTLTLNGTLEGASFVPPVEASVQYVLLESDPLLKASVSGAARRVSPNETGIPPRFRGAQAFLLGKGERLAFTAKKLETLHTTSFAIKSAHHLLYLPAEGDAIGESGFSIDNQGASEVVLPSEPRPTFASFGGEPVLLTKGADGKLTLPLAHGIQQLLVQHRQPFRRTAGFATATLIPAQIAAPASATAVEVRYPHEWLPLLESFSGETRFHVPDARALLAALLLALFTERVLWFLGLAGKKRLVLAVLLGLAALCVPSVAVVLLVADLAVTAILLVALARRATFNFKNALFAVVAGVAVLLAIPILTTARKETTYPASEAPMVADEGFATRRDAPAESRSAGKPHAKALGSGYVAKDIEAPASTPSAQPSEPEAYQGLPARVDIPAGETRTFFSREMLPGDAPRPVSVLAISVVLAFWLRVIPVALAAWALVVRREQLLAGLKERLAQAQRVPPPPVPQV